MKTREDRIKNVLKDSLPHGSGINGNWSIWQHSKDKTLWYASNFYQAMNEVGMYCHTYDFTLTLKVKDYERSYEIVRLNFHGQKEYACCGYGLKDYLLDTCSYID